MLDGIFAECYRRWGGRFSLIVPCERGGIPENYWPWLGAFDPDVLYSYVPLSEADVLEIHERLNPSIYQEHRWYGEPRLDVFGFSPNYDGSPLSSLSTIFRTARHRAPRSGQETLSILDCWRTNDTSRFISDNFGTYHWSYKTSVFPADAQQAVKLLTIVPPEIAQNHQQVPRGLETVPDELEAFRAITDRRAFSLAMAATQLASHLDMRLHRWGGSFNLVVGDSFADRIMFWNGRLLMPGWLDRDLTCLRVTPAQLDDEAFFSTLVVYLNDHNHVNDGSGGQTSLSVRSTSVGLADLETIVTRLRSGGCWNISRAQFVAKLDEMLPMEGDLEHATLGHRHGGGLFNMRPDWLSFACEGSTARPPRDFPEHLSDAPPRQQFTTGQWATEFVFEHDAPTPRLSEKNHWVLPRSWRMAEAFKATYSEAPRGERFAARTSRTGSLVLFESIDRPVQSVSIPTSIDAIRHALSRDGKWTRMHGYRGPLVPGNRVEWLSPSNEARYLNGVLGMAGGFDYARRSLLHPFMVNLFALLGGSPIPPSDKIAPIVQRLQERGRLNSAFDLSDEAEREALGTLIAKAARTLKSPSAFVKYTDIADRWRAHREAYWQRYGEKPAGDPNVDWEAHEQASVDSCLIKMRAQQLIFQGHQWTCPECHHRNWVDLSELRPILSCSICRHEDDAPIAIDWIFRPNEFLIESLRDHSVLSLLWVIEAMRDEAMSSFIHCGPTRFWYASTDDNPDAEADLLMIIDGRTVVCEVKSSWASLRASHIDGLAALALKLRANTALLAIMEPASNRQAGKIAEAGAALEAAGIKLRVMSLTSHPLNDEPYLA